MTATFDVLKQVTVTGQLFEKCVSTEIKLHSRKAWVSPGTSICSPTGNVDRVGYKLCSVINRHESYIRWSGRAAASFVIQLSDASKDV